MKQFFLNYGGEMLQSAYAFKGIDDDEMIIMSSEETTALFSLPDGLDGTDPRIKALDAKRFRFAFRAKVGISSAIPVDKIPDIITLNQGNSKVLFQLFFETFDIRKLSYSREGTKLRSFSQPKDKPYLFQFLVDLGFKTDRSGAAFNKLPTNVQQQLKKLNPSSMFDIQQLCLNFNSAYFQHTDITVFESYDISQGYESLRSFFEMCFKTIDKDGKGVSLGYAVKPQSYNPQDQQPSIIPTDLALVVSPYQDAQGKEMLSNQKLYTLNYLMMTQKHPLPPPVQMGWNWIDEQEQKLYHGTMSIRRAIFAAFLSKVLSPALNDICYSPTCKAVAHRLKKNEFSCEFNKDSSSLFYSPSSEDELLNFRYQSTTSSEDSSWGSEAAIKAAFDAKSLVTVKGNIITIITTTRANLDLHDGSDRAGGDILYYIHTVIFEIKANGDALVVTLVKKDTQKVPVAIAISTFLSFGNINEVITKIRDQLATTFQDFFSNYETHILNIVHNSYTWVFPGGRTFFFKEVYFSDYQDLITHVTYQDPS